MVGFMLFFGASGAVFAQTDIASSTEPAVEQVTKWDVIRQMQKGKLEAGKTYETSFTDEELDGFFDRELSSLNMKWFVEYATVRIHDGTADIMAKVLRPVKGNVAVRGTIEVRDGRAYIHILSAKYGYFPVPASFVERIGNFVMKQKSIVNWLDIGNGHWDVFDLRDGEAIIKVSAPSEE
jgi:hypothetical protein